MKEGPMPKMVLQISAEIKKIISRHPEINWETLAKDAIWDYAKKLQLADKITNKKFAN